MDFLIKSGFRDKIYNHKVTLVNTYVIVHANIC